jgi:hypothetical protein
VRRPSTRAGLVKKQKLEICGLARAVPGRAEHLLIRGLLVLPVAASEGVGDQLDVGVGSVLARIMPPSAAKCSAASRLPTCTRDASRVWVVPGGRGVSVDRHAAQVLLLLLAHPKLIASTRRVKQQILCRRTEVWCVGGAASYLRFVALLAPTAHMRLPSLTRWIHPVTSLGSIDVGDNVGNRWWWQRFVV